MIHIRCYRRETSNMTGRSKKEYIEELRWRYKGAGRKYKKLLLDQCCEICGFHRKHAIRALNGRNKSTGRRSGPESTYTQDVIDVLEALWLLINRPCSSLLKANIPLWLPFYTQDNAISMETREKLLQISASTVNRLLKPSRRKYGSHGLGATRPNLSIKFNIPIKTHHSDVDRPGYVQADSVAHGGNSVEGDFVYSLTMTDVDTQWTENRAVWNKGYSGISEAINDIESCLPFPILGFHSDNGGEFLNHHLYRYFQNRTKPVAFTRTRPDHKDDNAYVEQKNWTHVRQLLGYQRIDNPDLIKSINLLYKAWGAMHNLFCCTQKLESKIKVGSKYQRKYEKIPRSPAQRLIESEHVDQLTKTSLTEQMTNINPIKLKKLIDNLQGKVLSNLR